MLFIVLEKKVLLLISRPAFKLNSLDLDLEAKLPRSREFFARS